MKCKFGKLLLAAFCSVLVLGAAKLNVSAAGQKIGLSEFNSSSLGYELIEKYDTDKDGYLDETEITAITSLDLRHRGYRSLTGLNYLTSLKTLDVRYNQLTGLDVSKLTNLVTLKCSSNYLKSLDVSNNTKLKTLYVTYNNLDTLDLSNNPNLTDLNIGYNNLAGLNLDKNTKLTALGGSAGNMRILNGSKNADGQFEYDLSTLPGGFDVKKASDLSSGKIVGNKLVVDAGVREVTYTYQLKEGVSAAFSFTLFQPIKLNATNFPDETLRNYAIAHDTNGNGYLSYSETSNADMLEFDTLTSGKGLELLYALEYVYIDEYLGTELDLSKNRNLREVDIYEAEQLSKLTMGGAYKLKKLVCRWNALTSINLTRCVRLEQLDLNDNRLKKLDLSKNLMLKELDVSYGELTELNVSACTILEKLNVNYTELETLNLPENNSLIRIDVDSTALKNLDLSNCKMLAYLNIDETGIESLNLMNCSELRELHCRETKLKSLNVSNCLKLKKLDCSDAPMKTLDLSLNTALTEVTVFACDLEVLKLPAGDSLDYLYAADNKLTSIDLSNCKGLDRAFLGSNELIEVKLDNPKLTYLSCAGNKLTSLVLNKCSALKTLDCNSNPLTSLNVTNLSELTTLNVSWCQLTGLDATGCKKLSSVNTDNCGCTLVAKKSEAGNYHVYLSHIPGDFDASKVVSWENATLKTKTVIVESFSRDVRYEYDLGNGMTTKFRVRAVKDDSIITGYIYAPDYTFWKTEGDELELFVTSGLACTYQWYKSTDGNKWTACSSEGSNTWNLKLTAKESYDGLKFKCHAKYVSPDGKETGEGDSPVFTLRVTPYIRITEQPEAVSAIYGDKVTFRVKAEGYKNAALTYQWKKSADGGKTWVNSSSEGAKTAGLSMTVKSSFDGLQFKCLIKDEAGHEKYSNAVKLSVTGIPPVITTQPADQTVTAGGTATFKVAATGDGLTYRWKKSTDGGKTWVNSSSTGATTDTLTMTTKASYNGLQFKCIVTNQYGKSVTSKAVTLTVHAAVAITTQPANQTVTAGGTATFKVAATGDGLTYRWKKSTDGGKTWVNSSSTGAATNTLTMTTKASYNGLQFKCIVTDQYGKSVTSNTATLTIK